jgi:hypothetical protein
LVKLDGIKETYNDVEITNALSTIKKYAFNSSFCNNYTDPLILHLRIKSNNVKMHENLANSLTSILYDKLLDSNLYSYTETNNNICDTPISYFRDKVIIIVHPYETNILLNEYMKPLINAHTNSLGLRLLRNENINNDLNYTLDEMKYYNTKQLTIVNPDEYINRPDKQINPDFTRATDGGCQMVGIIYSVNDSNYKKHTEFFNENNSAFVLKPDILLYETQSKIYENIAKPIIYK